MPPRKRNPRAIQVLGPRRDLQRIAPTERGLSHFECQGKKHHIPHIYFGIGETRKKRVPFHLAAVLPDPLREGELLLIRASPILKGKKREYRLERTNPSRSKYRYPGFATLRKNVVTSLHISQPMRRKGIGRALMELAARDLLDAGYKEMVAYPLQFTVKRLMRLGFKMRTIRRGKKKKIQSIIQLYWPFGEETNT